MYKSASTLGSLINPNRFLGSHMLMKAEIDRLLQLLEAVIAKDPSTAPEQHELGVASQGLARAAQLLADRYHVVLTNVPYLGRGKQDRTLKEHLETYYDRGKADLAAAFVLRCLEFCNNQGTATFVSPQNWWFLSSYSSLRESLLIQYSLLFCATLGEEAWQSFGDRGPVATLSARLPDGRRLELADIYVLLNTTHPRHGEVFEALEASLPQDVLLDFRRLHSMGRARDQDAYTESTDNRLRRFLSPITGAMCSGSAPGIDFGEIIRRRHVLLVNLKSTFISREVANTVGGLVINEIVNAMMRADEEKGIRTPHHLVIDEASEFLGEDFGYILTKARKWGLSLVLSAQSRSSFRRGEVDVWENVTNCCKTVVSFQQKNVPDVRELGEFFAFPNRVLYEMYRVMDRPAPELDEIIETVDRGRAQTSGVSNTSTRSDNVGVSRGEAEGESESESYSVTDSEGKGTSKSNTWSRGWGGGSSSSRGRGKSDATHSHPVLRDGRLQMLRSEGDTVNVSASSSDFSSTHEGEGGSEGLHFSENRAVSRGGSTSTYASTDRRVSHNVTRGEATSESHSETASETVRQNLVQRTREEWHPTGNARYAIPYQNAIHEFLLTTLGDQFAFVRTKINNIEQTCLFRVADVHPPFRDATEAREKTRAFRERLLRSKPYMIFDPQLPEASESKRLDALVRPPETQPKITPGKGRPSSGPFSLE
jgi:hypothetical protein